MPKDSNKPIKLAKVNYVGGLPGEKGSERPGTLFVDPNGIGWGWAFKPTKGMVSWSDMRGVSFESGTAAKSRAGKALLIGVFALAAKKTQSDAHFSVFLHDGNVAIYHIVGMSGPALRAKVQPFLIAGGVPCLDDQVTAPEGSPPAPVSKADELAKLAALRDSGVLTEEEFATEKANLLRS
jgi:hypothetical protein